MFRPMVNTVLTGKTNYNTLLRQLKTLQKKEDEISKFRPEDRAQAHEHLKANFKDVFEHQKEVKASQLAQALGERIPQSGPSNETKSHLFNSMEKFISWAKENNVPWQESPETLKNALEQFNKQKQEAKAKKIS